MTWFDIVNYIHVVNKLLIVKPYLFLYFCITSIFGPYLQGLILLKIIILVLFLYFLHYWNFWVIMTRIHIVENKFFQFYYYFYLVLLDFLGHNDRFDIVNYIDVVNRLLIVELYF